VCIVVVVLCVLLLVVLCVLLLLSWAYCCHLMCICCTMCGLLFFTLDTGLLARSQYSRKVPRPATSTQVFLGLTVSISKY
jgi:hypothetical protein